MSRIKICVNFHNYQNNNYDDNITCKFLINKINNFLPNSGNIEYAYFQKSNYCNDYSIVFYPFSDSINRIKDLDLKVIGYLNKNNSIKIITNESRIKYKYYDFIWYTSPGSFIQPDMDVGNYVHDIVKEWLFYSDDDDDDDDNNNNNNNNNILKQGNEIILTPTNFDLSIFNRDELIEILDYINSVVTDDRFTYLQNEITKEISKK